MAKKKASTKTKRYNPQEIEPKWQKKWAQEELYKFKLDSKKQKYYNLVELPYPSGDLHLGHWFSFVTADTHARYKQMQGYNVFFPNGFDAFGLPAENAAIKRGLNPKDWTMSNIATMHKQFDTMGTMIDWSHEAITCLPEYYQWNQWIFLKMFERGLAYRGKALGNWCPVDKTVLANEHVEAGKCWRCGAEVIQKEIEQWFLKLTAYADDLIWPEDPKVNWPKSVREGQNKWIGRSQGVELEFVIASDSEAIPRRSAQTNQHEIASPRSDGVRNDVIKVFTTALDTVYGVTFMVISPENPLVKKITTNDHTQAVEQYVEESAKKSELERMSEGKEKTGVFTGSYVINPFNGEEIPVWVADYVIMSYGTGAVMGVPGHDSRDHEFAKKFDLEIKPVIKPADLGNGFKLFHVGKDGFWDYQDIKANKDNAVLFNSGQFDGLTSSEAKTKMEDFIEKNDFGKRRVQYHIHDWSISRQRYWGTPIPVVHCPIDGIVAVPEDQLPVVLPEKVDFTPKGEPPLATAKEWLHTTCPKCGGSATREPETMDTFFDSSWYFYRYMDPTDTAEPFSKDLAKVLMPVDIYYGGAEHTLGHTLYARFFTKFFKELGLVEFDEFAHIRVQHGVILGPDGNRMSKSRGNVVNPDDLVLEFGSDTVRTYLCFMMPYEATAPWSPEGIWGCYRLLKRVWDLQSHVKENPLDRHPGLSRILKSEQVSNLSGSKDSGQAGMTTEDLVQMHKTIKKVGDDIESMKLNTAVAAIMTWMNHLENKQNISRIEYINLILMLTPFAPHITEEIWQELEGTATERGESFSSIHQQKWPIYDRGYLIEETLEIVVQINGKMRDSLKVQSSELADRSSIENLALASGKIRTHLEGKEIKKVIYVPGKILNFVVV